MEQLAQKNLLDNEDQIVEQAKTDDQAFGVLYSHYFPKVYGFLLKRVGNREVAEDLMSETFIKVFTNIKKYQGRGVPFGAWLFKIATNNLFDYYRKTGRRPKVDIEAITPIKDEKIDQSEQTQIELDRELVNKIILEIPKKYQEILQLKFFAELSYQEISVTLGITENNARVLIFRALKIFQKYHQKYELKFQ
jgi:RNA polymerase sigma-70 factor (ECF subfamily)